MSWGRSSSLRRDELHLVNAVHAARQVDATPGAAWALYLMLAVVVCALGWASIAQVDMIARADARVVPDGKEQLIASLEGGILRELLVREGQSVEQGQPLALLDPTRLEAQQNEGQTKRLSLRAAIARLQAESQGRPLQFPSDLKAQVQLVAGETESFNARQRALMEAVSTNQRSLGLLERELAVAEQMSAKGLMSEVEVMRVRRQVNELTLQNQDRINRFRQEASAELVRLQSELTQFQEQMVVRDDALRRTTLTSPVKGLIKSIKSHTLGGVVAPGASIMEIVPIGGRVLVEARIRPADIGFVRVGNDVQIKLTAYESTVYGSLHGTVQSISPDVLGDTERAPSAEATWYRAQILADGTTLQAGGKPLPVLPGMSGQAEIRTGERSVLSYLLRPWMKAREAFQER